MIALEESRRCSCWGCGYHDGQCVTICSTRNDNQMCWPCIDYQLAHAKKLPLMPPPQRNRAGTREKQQQRDYEAVLNALKARQEPFTAHELGLPLGLSGFVVARYLRKAEGLGLVRQREPIVPKQREKRGRIMLWEAVA